MNRNGGPASPESAPWRNLHEQQARDAAFLWHLRSAAVHQPDYRPQDLAQLEQRIDNRLNALLHGSDLAWEICNDELSIRIILRWLRNP